MKSPRASSRPTSKPPEYSLEKILTHPDLFGLTTAINVQKAKCRILEGRPLGDLADDPAVIEMCGGAVPDFHERPSEMLDISAIRIGKSLFAAAVIFWLTQTADLSQTRSSDIVRVFVVALKIGGTEAVLKHLMTPLVEKPAFRRFLVDDPKDITLGSIKKSGLRIKQLHSGRTIEVTPVPLDKGGGSGVSVYSAGVVIDEYPRMAGADDGVKNVEHFRDAVVGRLLPGAVLLATGSPWQPYGPAYDMVAKWFGKASRDLVVLRTSAKPFVNVAPAWTPASVEKLRRTSPIAYKTDYLAEFADGEEAVFPAVAIEDAWIRPAEKQAEYGKPAVFADPSALRHDYWAAMVGGWVHPIARPQDLYQVEFLGDEIKPGRGQVVAAEEGWIRILEDEYGRPLKRVDNKALRPIFEVYDIVSWDSKSGARGLDLVRAVGEIARRYGCEDFHWDGYEQLMLGDLIRQQGLRPVVHTWAGAGRKTEAVDALRTLLVERRLRLGGKDTEAGRSLKDELLRFRAKATPGGNFQYVVAGGGGHGDHASCLTLAMRADLDGYVDNSPTRPPTIRHEVTDYYEAPSFY